MKFLELKSTEGIVLINIDKIDHIKINDRGDTIITTNCGRFSVLCSFEEVKVRINKACIHSEE